MGRHDNFSAMVAWGLLIYSIMGCCSAVFSAATARGYSYSLSALWAAVLPVIRLSDRWWNSSSTFSVTPNTTQLSLPYISTNWANTLYIIPQSALLRLSFPSPPQSSSTSFVLSLGYDKLPENLCCYRRSSSQVQWRPLVVTGPLNCYVTRPQLP